jgi:hypothetical protein
MIRTTSAVSSKYFQLLFMPPKALMTLLPREDVHKERADPDDGDH